MNQLVNYRKFMEKVKAGKPLTVVYFGGSITAGGATYPETGIGMDGKEYHAPFDVNKDCWRERTFQWIKDHYEQFPGQFKQINASIGGTGSLFGAIRLAEDVLKYKPDFVFIEYAVNDNGVSAITQSDPYNDKSLFRTLLSIMNRIYKQNPEVVLFMPLTTYRLGIDKQYESWQAAMQQSADYSEQFCNVYGIPYVSAYEAYYTDKICKNVQTDKLYMGADIPGNDVHPALHGHEMIACAVETTLEKLFDCFEFPFKDLNPQEIHFDQKKLTPYPVLPSFVFANRLIPNEDIGSFRVIQEGDGHTLINGRKVFFTQDLQCKILYSFKGSMIGGWFDYGSVCNIEIWLDGKHLGDWTSNNKTNGVFGGDQYAIFAGNLDKDQTHHLEMIPAVNQEPNEGLSFSWGFRALFVDEWIADESFKVEPVTKRS